MWVLKYIWDTEDQIEILEGIINNIIDKEEDEKSHPQALLNKAPNPEEVMKEVQYLKDKWQNTCFLKKFFPEFFLCQSSASVYFIFCYC